MDNTQCLTLNRWNAKRSSLSLSLSALIGFYFTNKNKSLDSYMLGDRNLSLIPVALSLMTSCMSGLSLLGCSAELYYQGASYSFVSMSMLLCGPIISYTIVPVFYRLNQLSLYKVSCAIQCHLLMGSH